MCSISRTEHIYEQASVAVSEEHEATFFLHVAYSLNVHNSVLNSTENISILYVTMLLDKKDL